MKTYCMVNRLNPKGIEHYVKTHETAHLTKWKKQIDALATAGAENCCVYLYEDLSIVVMECDDLNKCLHNLSKDAGNQEWQVMLSDCFALDTRFDGTQKQGVKKIFDMRQQKGGYLSE